MIEPCFRSRISGATRANHSDNPENIRVELPPQQLVGEGVDRTGELEPRIVDQNIDGGRLPRLCDRPIDQSLVGDVQLNRADRRELKRQRFQIAGTIFRTKSPAYTVWLASANLRAVNRPKPLLAPVIRTFDKAQSSLLRRESLTLCTSIVN